MSQFEHQPARYAQWFRSLPRIRFSLFGMLVAITIVAVLIGLSVTVGNLVAMMFFAIVCCVVPTPLVIAAIVSRGDVQAFAIGALVPWAMVPLWMRQFSLFALFLSLVIMPPICGAVATITRRWLEP